MAERTEVEGQALARDVLAALDGGRRPDWAPLDRAYREFLLRVAAGRLAAHPALRQHTETPEELLNAYLARKVYPRRQSIRLLGPVARGDCPLLPRLAVSLGNFARDLLRGRAHPRPDELEPESLPANEPRSPPTYEDVAAFLARQLRALRTLPLAPAGAAPYRTSLTLRHRLGWATAFDGTNVRDGDVDRPLSLTDLEALTVWTPEEEAAHLGEGVRDLVEAWFLVRPLFPAETGPPSAGEVAGAIRVTPGLWSQWFLRGRTLLRERLGADYRAIFPTWG